MIIAVASNNQLLATNKLANCYQVRVWQQEWKPPWTQYLTLTLCPLFDAPVIILSVAIVLVVFISACWQTKHYIKCHVKLTIIHQNVTHILYANNLMIIRVRCHWILTYVIVILKCEQSRILMLTCVKQEENSSCCLYWWLLVFKLKKSNKLWDLECIMGIKIYTLKMTNTGNYPRVTYQW